MSLQLSVMKHIKQGTQSEFCSPVIKAEELFTPAYLILKFLCLSTAVGCTLMHC